MSWTLKGLLTSIRFKGYHRGIPRLNHKKQIKNWLDQKVHKNGGTVLIQYLRPPTLVDSPYLDIPERKRLILQRSREGFVTQVSQTLAKLLINSGEAKLVGG